MKRLAGEGGICEAGYRYFIDKMGIGYKAFKKSKEYLLEKKWISFVGKKRIMTSGGEQLVDCYRINDIWKLNNEHYQGGVKRKHPSSKVVSKENKVVLKGNQGGAERKQKKNSKNIKNMYHQILKEYQSKINKKSRLTDSAKKKIIIRLKCFSLKELIMAIDNFSKEEWWMKNNSNRGIAWFFNSDDRIEQFINLEIKQTNLKDKIYGYKK